jgi:hypothetical protein
MAGASALFLAKRALCTCALIVATPPFYPFLIFVGEYIDTLPHPIFLSAQTEKIQT